MASLVRYAVPRVLQPEQLRPRIYPATANPTVDAGITPAVVACVTTIPTPAIPTGAAVTAAAVACSTTVPTPTVVVVTDATITAVRVACDTLISARAGISNAYLTTTAADAAVTVGAGTLRRANWTAGASSTLQNVNTVAGPTTGVQLTDSTTAGTNGTAVSWYTPPLLPVTIAGQIVASLWGRESAVAANAAPCFRVERCSGNGTILSTIVDQSTAGSSGSLEFATTAGGATKTCTVPALNVVDTTLATGDRLRITLWIDDASGQGGSGSMGTGFNTQLYVNGPNGAAGQATFTFAEALTEATAASDTAEPAVVRGTATIPTPTVVAGSVDSTASPAVVAATATIPAPSVGVAPLGNPTGGPWTLVFEDHFDTGTVPNPAVWADYFISGDFYRTNDNPSELEWYPHNKRGLSIASSILTLTARLEDPQTIDPLCPNPLPSGNTGTYTSGMIQSKPGFAFTRGYMESYARVNGAISGGWPAFWAWNADAVWTSELDVLEWFATAAPGGMGYMDGPAHTYSTTAPDGNWHTYGCRWSPTDVTFFVDGAQVAQFSGTTTTDPWHIVWNLAMGNPNGAATGSGMSVDVDYVRAWTQQGVPAAPVVTSLTPADGVPTAGTLQVAFNTVGGATSYRATSCPVDGHADSWNGSRHVITGASSPLTITGLQNGVRYGVTVAAVNATGYSIESAIAGGSFAPVPPAVVAATTTIPAPAVSTATNATISATKVTAAVTVPTPTVVAGQAATATPAKVAGVLTVPTPTVAAVVNVNATVVAAVATIPQMTGSADSTATPAVAAVTTTIPTPSVTAGGNATVSPAKVAGATTIPTPGISAGGSATANATVVASSTTIPAPTITVASSITPAVLLAVTTVPTPAVTSAASVTATVVAATTTIPVPTVTVTTSATVTPAVVAASTSIPTPGIVAGGSVTITAAVVVASTTVPAPAFSSSAAISPTRVLCLTTVPVATIAAGATVAAQAVLATVIIPQPTVPGMITLTPTPSDRVLAVYFEQRIVTVAAESRAVAVSPESRVLTT